MMYAKPAAYLSVARGRHGSRWTTSRQLWNRCTASLSDFSDPTISCQNPTESFYRAVLDADLLLFETPSRSQPPPTAQSFLTGLMTPPASNMRRTSEPESASTIGRGNSLSRLINNDYHPASGWSLTVYAKFQSFLTCSSIQYFLSFMISQLG
ncbi:hypothetical protein EJ08DRAFT_477470 [Tothia fuscella]|uniref:Uncharacterized protein n=1 Tax=Tothia fuscella TaxID=1048955 RepID=A0A9P4NI89_9PEZI|nr:hypothetical protein EJ08DRAFT_477470 [Tothia fuscella]